MESPFLCTVVWPPVLVGRTPGLSVLSELCGIPRNGCCRERAPNQSLVPNPEKGWLFIGTVLPRGAWCSLAVRELGSGKCPGMRGQGSLSGNGTVCGLVKGNSPGWALLPLETYSVDLVESTSFFPLSQDSGHEKNLGEAQTTQ